MRTRLELNPLAQAIAGWLERTGQLEAVQTAYHQKTALVAILGRRLLTYLRPQQADNHYQLARALLRQEHWHAAVQACQRAIHLSPDLAWAYFTLGEAWQGQGQWHEAVQAFNQAIALDATVAWFHYGLGKTYMSQEAWDLAIAALQRATTLDPQAFWPLYSLGEAQVKAGHWSAAIATLQTARTQQPTFPWSYYHLGDALLAENRLEEALTAYRQAVQLRPHNPYMQQSLNYALHLHQQERNIQAYCQQHQAQPASGEQLTILMIMPYAPYPPKTGAIARMFHELKGLGAKHRVVLVALMFAKEDYQFERELEAFCDLAVLVAIGDAPVRQPGEPKLVHRYSSQRLRRVLRQLQPIPFDIVSCNFVYMAQYRTLFPDAFHVLAEHNIESELLKRSADLHQGTQQVQQLAEQTDAVKAFVAADHEADLLAAYENEVWPTFPLRTVVSDRDQQCLDERCSTGQTLVVNNGIDTHAITPIPQAAQPRMLFIGTMSYYPNIDAVTYCVNDILPHIWQQDPTIEFWIAGATPPKHITDLGRDPRIQVIANPEDMSDVAKACSMSIVPLRFGSGTRIKILHSMAMGLPVVSTSLGCEGLQVEAGVHLLIQDCPRGFAEAVVGLMQDTRQQHTLRQQGRQLVEQHYDWTAIYKQAEHQYVQAFRAWHQHRQLLRSPQ